MRKSLWVTLSVATLGLAGCAIGPVSPVQGWLWTDVKYPSYYDGAAELGPGAKQGTASATSILGLIATGDASVAAAARDGGIGKIHTVDQRATNFLGIFATYTTEITGQ